MAETISKHDEYLEAVKEFAVYVNHEEKIVGIYSTNKDSLKANNSLALKKLIRNEGYKIQMVIK